VRAVVVLLLLVLGRPRGQVFREHLEFRTVDELTPESVLAIPSVGVQLTTTRFLAQPSLSKSCLSYSTSKTFIPIHDIATIVINEGLHRWSVRYFLAVIMREGRGIHVAFDVSSDILSKVQLS
jgi:phosphatidylinositol glycan class H protein